MFKQKRSLEDARHFVDSLLMDDERLEASYIWAASPLTFMAVTSHRCIGTKSSQGGEPIIISVPFDQIAAVAATVSDGAPTLAEDPAPYIFIHASYGDTLSINGNSSPEQALQVYDALLRKTCRTGRVAGGVA